MTQAHAPALRIGFLLGASVAVGSPGDGIRVQACAQARALRRLGHRVELLSPWDCRSTEDLNGFDIIQFFAGGLPAFSVTRNVAHLRARCVFATIIDSNEPFWRYRLMTRLGTLSARLFTIPGELRRQALQADRVVVRSEHERERIVRGLGCPAERVDLVLNGVDPPEPGSEPDPSLSREHFGIDGPFCLHVSTYDQARKNVARLIEALGPTGLPLIVGGNAHDGPVKRRIHELADRYQNVRFVGYLDPPMRDSLYAACRVFCLPSSHEGTGLVALEAAAQGAAVVITDRGGPPDYFMDLAEYCDFRDLASIRSATQRAWRRMKSLGDQPGADADPGVRLHTPWCRHVRERLTWDASARSLEAVYRRALLA